MNRLNRPWVRGTLTLGILAALAAGLMLSPVGAAGTLTKSKVKKIAKKQANTAVTNDNNTNEGIYATFVNATDVAVPNTSTAVATLQIPPGHYAIFAKVHIEDTAADVNTASNLVVGADNDVGEAEAEAGTINPGLTIANELTHTANTTETVEYRLNDAATGDTYSDVQLIAIRAPALTKTSL